ncbi:helix-turn-helix transcriptional regulator [Crassaminicella profunda]|uniref:helix-turn-helix transcriptional regulator n=1 Tax=Crassaminicella profunda TaxID=1286698 RepID=UPI001CA6764A|nr:YafY family protein [Crassaminicella profunda]QZY56866.1 YafY family transcriptional regulator [Crassaminicella profunda]
MQINRLFEIVMILLKKERVTAKELAQHFGVSTRTIYRDIDTLSLSNIPIYTNKGSRGGIRILPQFTMDKSLFSEEEQSHMIAALHGLKATKYAEVDMVITKLAALFKNTDSYNWIEVDFSHWGSNRENKNKFNSLKDAILNRRIVGFDYVNSYGVKAGRAVEPIKLVFKGQGWYLQGFCKDKQDIRVFRISRINNLVVKEQTFEHTYSMDLPIEAPVSNKEHMVTLKLKFEPEVTYRVYDDFGYENITHYKDGGIEASITFPKGEWVYGYILSFGKYVQVIEPKEIREKIKETLRLALKVYE